MLRAFLVALIVTFVTSAALALAHFSRSGGENALPVVEVPARWNTSSAQSVASLRETPLRFIGEVLALREQRAAGATGSTASLPVTLFDVRVMESLAGGLAAGDAVVVQQAGGEVTLSGGRRAVVVLEGDRPLEPGARYLFFVPASALVNGRIITQPFNRLELTNSGLQPLTAWQHLDGLAELSGSSTGEAQRALDGASR
jgi:hypothetical protein